VTAVLLIKIPGGSDRKLGNIVLVQFVVLTKYLSWGFHNGGYEVYCFIERDSVHSGRNSSMFRRILIYLSTGSNREPSTAVLAWQLFDPEAECSTFLRNIGELLSDYTAPHPRR
jgi:hypothetical protein